MKKGQSLFEVILALALFSLFATAMVEASLGGFIGLLSGGDRTQAALLADEAIEAVRSVRDGAWNEIKFVQSQAIVSGSQWVLNGLAASETIGKFLRTVSFSNVCRNASGAYVTCPSGAVDIHVKQVIVTVSWQERHGTTLSVSRATYVSNWDSHTWRQTDWSGGGGQATWSNVAKFYSTTPSNSIEYIGGEIKLKNTSGDPGTWVPETAAMNLPPTGTQLNGIDMLDENNAWIVGNSKKLMRFSNGSWALGASNISPSNTNFRGAQMLSATDGWVVGNNGWIVRCLVISNTLQCNNNYAGSRDLGNQTWNSIFMVSATDGWAVGDRGAIAHYTSGAWSLWSQNPKPTTEHLNGIHMVSSTDGWAVGNSGKIIRFISGSWTATSNGATDTGSNIFYDVHMYDVNNGIAVSTAGRVYRWNGSLWSQMLNTGTQIWYGVASIVVNDMWVVGSGGNIRYWDGGSLTVVPPANGHALRAVDVYKKADTSVLGFAVGDSNTVLRLTRSPSYAMSGELISSAFDMGDMSPVQVLELFTKNTCVPVANCRVRIQISIGGSPSDMNWMGWDGSASTYFDGTSPLLLPTSFNGARWLRYKVRLEGPGANTPILEEIRMNYK